jgi:hypothetical protein
MPPIVTVLGARIRFANLEPGFSDKRRETGTPRSFATDFFNFARQQKLYVCWMGIQEMAQPQCEPFPDCECQARPQAVEPTTVEQQRMNLAMDQPARRVVLPADRAARRRVELREQQIRRLKVTKE